MPWPKYMNVTRFESLLAESDFDAVVASSLKNVYYTSGALIETQRRIPLRLALTVLPREGDPTFIVCNIEERHARDESPIEDIRTYVEFQESPIEMLADVLREKGLDKKTVGIEKEHLMATYYEELLRRLPKVKLEAADNFFAEVRMIKTPPEIKVIKQAAIATEQAIFDAFVATKPGTQEKDLALKIQNNVISLGADSIRACVLGSGPNSLRTHHIPTEKPLLKGELVRLDFSAYFGAYASDIARMAVVETVSSTIQDVYKRYREIQRATIAQLKPGTRACDAYNYCKAAFEKAGMALHTPHIGHSTGVDGGHQEPMLHPNNQQELEPNMMFYVEPFFRDPNVGAYHVEDLVLITEEGPEILTTYSDTEEIYVIK
jgi:Xaa-Pro dipeptidase